MTFFRIFIKDASDRHFTYFISAGSLHVSYVIVAAFCQLCLINIIIIIIIIIIIERIREIDYVMH